MWTLRPWAGRGTRLAVVAVLAAVAALAAPVPAAAQGGTFTATGDIELVPGGTPDPTQAITLTPALAEAKVNLPVELGGDAVAVDRIDAQGASTPCPVLTRPQVYLCTAPRGTVIASIFVTYHLPPVIPVGARYPLTVPVVVTDVSTGATATVHATVRPHTDMALRGPYVGNVPPTDGGVIVTVANQGPSASAGSRLTVSITGTFTVIAVLPATTCTGTGGQIACHFGSLQAGEESSVSIALGTDSGAIQVAAQVTGDDLDPQAANNSGAGGPWTVFSRPGTPGSGPVPPPVPPPVPLGVPASVPPPSVPAGASPPPVPSPAGSASAADPPPVRAVAGTWHWPLSHYVALTFLGGSALYLLLGGAGLLRRRWRRRPGTHGELEIDLDS